MLRTEQGGRCETLRINYPAANIFGTAAERWTGEKSTSLRQAVANQNQTTLFCR